MDQLIPSFTYLLIWESLTLKQIYSLGICEKAAPCAKESLSNLWSDLISPMTLGKSLSLLASQFAPQSNEQTMGQPCPPVRVTTAISHGISRFHCSCPSLVG